MLASTHLSKPLRTVDTDQAVGASPSIYRRASFLVATSLLAATLVTAVPTAASSVPTFDGEAIVAAARELIGTPYDQNNPNDPDEPGDQVGYGHSYEGAGPTLSRGTGAALGTDENPGATDCSGLSRYAYAGSGIDLTIGHTQIAATDQQIKMFDELSELDLPVPGDLVFFGYQVSTGGEYTDVEDIEWEVKHVGVFSGLMNGVAMMIDSPGGHPSVDERTVDSADCEAPQVFCRSYAGCGSRVRVA